jgi:hypothetical protein
MSPDSHMMASLERKPIPTLAKKDGIIIFAALLHPSLITPIIVPHEAKPVE